MNNRSNMIKMGNHIADLRKKKGYTQKTLGDILDVSDKTVCKWEKGIVAPDITILSSLANTLDVSVEEILSGEEVKTIDTLETIDLYSNITKRKLLKIFAIFILLFLLCTFFVFRVEDHYSWHLTPLYSEGNISSVGYIISNNKESKIMINKIFFNEEISTDVVKVEITLNDNKKQIYFGHIILDNNKNINDNLENYMLNIDYDKSLKPNDLKLIVTVYETNDNLKTYQLFYK